jgi:hypothetical protein
MAVTLTVAAVYLAILIPLIVIHTTVPAPPTNPIVYRGLNLTEAWLDLKELSNGYHPFNSRRNDEIRDWLLRRITTILESNQVEFHTDSFASKGGHADYLPPLDGSQVDASTSPLSASHEQFRTRDTKPSAVIFSDLVSNYTSTALTSIGVSGRRAGISTYFEGNNIIVYIRGTEDEEGEWWKQPHQSVKRLHGKGGVMVNVHFDSVSTGYGATDDGVGVTTALQLVKYFTTEGNAPKRGVIALFNNGEEDGLYGAKAFLSHPMSSFVHVFLNLEGAGAGGRATLFRSTDTEVTRAYSKAPHPFGTVVSADGFSLGFVRSETDYIVFRAEGYRGLDVAFWEPRSRYHTDQDDAKHTSQASLWHMLSASVETMKSLTSDTDQFIGRRGDGDTTKVSNGWGTDGVWFDILGTVMPVFRLRTLFALSLALLIASPLVLMLITYSLVKSDRYYLWCSAEFPPAHQTDYEMIYINGWRGFWRYPIVLFVTAALTTGAAFLLRKVNPLIVYSSQYTVWAMSLSLFFFTFWFLMAGTDAVRPSALHKAYATIWMFSFGWLLLIAAIVFEDRFKISGGYMFVIYECAIFFATLISLCELWALPRKECVVDQIHSDEHDLVIEDGIIAAAPVITPITRVRSGSNRMGYDPVLTRSRSGTRLRHHDGDGATEFEDDETTPLVGATTSRSVGLARGGLKGLLGSTFPSTFSTFSSFSKGYRRPEVSFQNDGAGGNAPNNDGPNDEHTRSGHIHGGLHHRHWDRLNPPAYGNEQNWSGRLPTWTWVLQFLILGPFIIIVIGQVGLLVVTATAQTGTDGSNLLLPYLLIALFSILVLLPVSPFMQRVTYHIPCLLFLVFVGTLIYNLTAFPFSENNRYKAYFQQTVDLESGVNHVTLAGIEQYIREIISYIPSASGQSITCIRRPEIRSGVSFCSWEGPAPRVVKNVPSGVPPEKGFAEWLSYNVTRAEGENKATFHISGKETKACIIRFDEPFTAFNVHGAAESDGRWADVPESGSDQIKLWHRDWDREWVVDVAWPVSNGKKVGQEGRSGRVVCLWADHNMLGTIPALDEVQRFAPKWATVTKAMDGLVEGSKPFVV